MLQITSSDGIVLVIITQGLSLQVSHSSLGRSQSSWPVPRDEVQRGYMSQQTRGTQPSISCFFRQKSSPAKISKEPVVVVVLDDDDDAKADLPHVTVASEKADATTTKKNSTHDRVQHYSYDEHYSPPDQTIEGAQRHERFKRTLDQQVNLFGDAQDQLSPNSDDEGDDGNLEETQPPAKKQKKAAKLTPLDQQVKELKLKHMDKVLAIQVGYKYKFYCQDAVRVHKILNIMLVPGKLNLVNETPADLLYNKLAYCSIPEPRLHIHLQRLLENGLKIGVVDQVETSAVKSVETKGALFTRQLSNVFTKATYIEFDDKNTGVKDDRAVDSLMAIVENQISDKISITMVSIQPLTGEIIYDEFEDDFLRNELNTRLLHLEPIEILYFEDSLSKLTSQALDAFIRLHASITNIRISTFPQLKRTYYETYLNSYVAEWPQLFDLVASKSIDFQISCSLLIEYLKEFKLDASFQVKENYKSFAEVSHMTLNANSLQNLEIFSNSTTGEEYGSLLWLMNHTRTKFGFRLLRKWISQPLVQREQIEERLGAVKNIQDSFSHFLENLAEIMKGCPDLEKILNRIHYGKVKRKELYIFLNKLSEIDKLVTKFGRFDIITRLQSPLLKGLFKGLVQLCLDLDIDNFIRMINSQYAMDERSLDHVLKYFNFTNLTVNHDEILHQNEEIKQINEKLTGELDEIRKFLRRPALEYVEKSKEPYLIEVRNSQVKELPKDWIKISATKLVSRFRTASVTALNKQLLYHNELYLQGCHTVFRKFIANINEHYTQFSTMIRCLSQYDCLLSLAATSSSSGFTRPSFVDKRLVKIEGGRNPIIEQLANFVPNSTSLSNDTHCMIITGPNMGGKSSYVKQVALIVIMAQIGCYVPAESATLGIFTTILTRMGAQDDLLKGESTFYTEMSQVLGILNEMAKIGGNKLVILDEIGRGTGTIDGISLAESILEYVIDEAQDSLTLFITHFPSICKLSDRHQSVENCHMGYIEEKSEDGDWPRVTFLYTLVPGMANNSYGLNVAKLAGVDNEVIKEAYKVSIDRKRSVEERTAVLRALDLRDGMKELFHGHDRTNTLKVTMDLMELIDRI